MGFLGVGKKGPGVFAVPGFLKIIVAAFLKDRPGGVPLFNVPDRTADMLYAPCKPTFPIAATLGMMWPWFEESSHGDEQFIFGGGTATARALARDNASLGRERVIAGGVLSAAQVA
jgi:hypothetical protein